MLHGIDSNYLLKDRSALDPKASLPSFTDSYHFVCDFLSQLEKNVSSKACSKELYQLYEKFYNLLSDKQNISKNSKELLDTFTKISLNDKDSKKLIESFEVLLAKENEGSKFYTPMSLLLQKLPFPKQREFTDSERIPGRHINRTNKIDNPRHYPQSKFCRLTSNRAIKQDLNLPDLKKVVKYGSSVYPNSEKMDLTFVYSPGSNYKQYLTKFISIIEKRNLKELSITFKVESKEIRYTKSLIKNVCQALKAFENSNIAKLTIDLTQCWGSSILVDIEEMLSNFRHQGIGELVIACQVPSLLSEESYFKNKEGLLPSLQTFNLESLSIEFKNQRGGYDIIPADFPNNYTSAKYLRELSNCFIKVHPQKLFLSYEKWLGNVSRPNYTFFKGLVENFPNNIEWLKSVSLNVGRELFNRPNTFEDFKTWIIKKCINLEELNFQIAPDDEIGRVFDFAYGMNTLIHKLTAKSSLKLLKLNFVTTHPWDFIEQWHTKYLGLKNPAQSNVSNLQIAFTADSPFATKEGVGGSEIAPKLIGKVVSKLMDIINFFFPHLTIFTFKCKLKPKECRALINKILQNSHLLEKIEIIIPLKESCEYREINQNIKKAELDFQQIALNKAMEFEKRKIKFKLITVKE